MWAACYRLRPNIPRNGSLIRDQLSPHRPQQLSFGQPSNTPKRTFQSNSSLWMFLLPAHRYEVFVFVTDRRIGKSDEALNNCRPRLRICVHDSHGSPDWKQTAIHRTLHCTVVLVMRREKQEERSVLKFGRIVIWKLRPIIRLQFQWDYFSK